MKMKFKKAIILALFLSLILIGTANAVVAVDDSQTQNINQMDETHADEDILLKTEELDSNIQIDENQEDQNLKE